MYRMTQNRSAIFSALFCIAIVALGGFLLFEGCGKLSDDTGHSSSPVGTSGGTAIPYGPRASMGTYTFSIAANPASIPADQTNFSTITVTVKNTSGLPTLGYTISFSADGESADNLGWFYDPVPAKFVNKADSTTDQNGTATIRFYGIRSGTSVVKAEVDIDEDGKIDLTVSTSVTLTPSGPPDTAGSYSLDIQAHPNTVPADMATYSILSATLRDSAGGSVENFTISFESELGYVHNDPTPPSVPSTTATCLTDPNGKCSIYYYGDRAGSAVVSASVNIPDLIGPIEDRVIIYVTEGPGEPGNGVPGISLDVAEGSSQYQVGTANEDTGTAEMEAITLEATVWDATGDVVGPGVRVEFSGAVVGFSTTDESGVAKITVPKTTLGVGSHTFSETACTYGINPKQTQYCDDISFGMTVLPPTEKDLEVEAKAVPETVEPKKKTTIFVTALYDGSPLSGATASFATGGFLTPTSTTASVQSNGVAQAIFTAGSRTGEETVFISVSGVDSYGRQVFGKAEASVTIETTTTTTKSTTTTTTTTTTTKP